MLYLVQEYKLDETTGNYVQIHLESNWFTTILFGSVSEQLKLSFGEGEYRASLVRSGGISALTGAGLYVDHDTIYDYGQPTTLSGSVAGDITPESTSVVLQVNDQAVTSDQSTLIQGEYGTLVIKSDGTYTYTVTKPVDTIGWEPPYGKVDSFNVVTKTAVDTTVIEVLNIKIGTNSTTDDFNTVQVNQSNLVTDDDYTADTGTATATVVQGPDNFFGISTDTWTNRYSKQVTVVVAEDTIVNGKLNITAETNTAVAINDRWGSVNATYTLKDAIGTIISSGDLMLSGKSLISDGTYQATISLVNLVAGAYTVDINVMNVTTVTSTAGLVASNNGEFTVKTIAELNVTDLNIFRVDSNPIIQGNLLVNDIGSDTIDQLIIGKKELYVNDDNKGANFFTVEGLYGTLTLSKDGSYSYQPSGKSYGVEIFTYKTVSILGIEETSKLEINVGKTINSSNFSDNITSSAGDDTFTTNAGADKVVFNLLNSTDTTGGNGHDTWTDFSKTQGDKVDISALLTGQSVTASNIGNYVKLTKDGADTVISIDRDGTGTTYQSTELLTLKNVNTTLDELLQNNHLIY